MKHKYWLPVSQIIKTLHAHKHTAYLAGGCVRDLLLNREALDLDVATSAKPDEIAQIFPRVLEVGRNFGVSILPFEGGGGQVEVATFRHDGPYQDGRHPISVQFSSPEEDAQRRDFTINALFFDIKSGQIIDFVQGQKDLQKQLIRAVGDPHRRFEEDRLRVLRAVRFAAQLNFDIEHETLRAISTYSNQLQSVSQERVHDELEKLIKTEYFAKGWHLMQSTGLVNNIFGTNIPENDIKENMLQLNSITPLDSQQQQKILRWCTFFKAFSSERVQQLLRQLRFSKNERDAILWVLSTRTRSAFLQPETWSRPAQFIELLAQPYARAAEALWSLDLHEATQRKELAQMCEKYRLEALPVRWIQGQDLLDIGMKPGREMGQLLERLYHDQLEGKWKLEDKLNQLELLKRNLKV